jgi:hypothetical protein
MWLSFLYFFLLRTTAGRAGVSLSNLAPHPPAHPLPTRLPCHYRHCSPTPLPDLALITVPPPPLPDPTFLSTLHNPALLPGLSNCSLPDPAIDPVVHPLWSTLKLVFPSRFPPLPYSPPFLPRYMISGGHGAFSLPAPTTDEPVCIASVLPFHGWCCLSLASLLSRCE